MPLPIGFSYGTGSLSSSFAAIAVAKDTTNESKSQSVPNKSLLDKVRFSLNTISSAAQITWYLAEDSLGKHALTPSQTTTIDTGLSASTFGFISASLDGFPYRRTSKITTAGTMYLIAKTDAGTATGEVFIHWRRA